MLPLALTWAIVSAVPPDDQDPVRVFMRVRDRLLAETVRLPRYTCVQTIERKYFQLEADQTAHRGCDAILGARRTRKHDLSISGEDRLRLDVAVASGHEIHSWAGANRFEDKEIVDIVGSGPSGTGDFRGFVQSVFGEHAAISFEGETNEGGRRLLHYTYGITREDSHYTIRSAGARVITGYEGSVVLDPESSDLLRLTVTTEELPEKTELCQVESEIDYRRINIHGVEIPVPQKTVLRMIARDSAETENVTSYANCREYSSTSVVRFEGEDIPVPAAPRRRKLAPPSSACRVGIPVPHKDQN